ncbi:MAG: DMT family transporter [Ignavibacteria bacterium]
MKNFLLLVFITLAACFTPIFAKVSVAEISPISLGFIRFGAAAVLFLITLLIRKGNLRFEKGEYPKLILLAFLCIPVNQFFFLTGIQHSYASHSGVIYSLNPVFAYLIAISRKYEKFYFSKLIAIILTIVGVFFVFYDGLTSTGANPEVVGGDTLLLFAVLSFSLYLALGKELIEKYGALKVSTYVFLAGSVLYIPLFIYDCHNLNFSKLTISGITGYLYLTIIMAYLAYFAWYYALKTIAISKITTMSNLSPLLTVFFSVIFLGEKPSAFLIIGGIIAIMGVIIMHKVSLELN